VVNSVDVIDGTELVNSECNCEDDSIVDWNVDMVSDELVSSQGTVEIVDDESTYDVDFIVV
jgi:hypothetical protein